MWNSLRKVLVDQPPANHDVARETIAVDSTVVVAAKVASIETTAVAAVADSVADLATRAVADRSDAIAGNQIQTG